ncbi:MAG: hypothetical protein CL482_15405 [Acidobacteria bacterium]|nr:hypothetical protein [Acidobacteriota bacterium]
MPWLGRKMDEGVSVGGRAACPVPTVDEATTIDRPEQATDTNLGPTPRASHPHRADQLCDFFVGFDYRAYIVGESSEYTGRSRQILPVGRLGKFLETAAGFIQVFIGL